MHLPLCVCVFTVFNFLYKPLRLVYVHNGSYQGMQVSYAARYAIFTDHAWPVVQYAVVHAYLYFPAALWLEASALP